MQLELFPQKIDYECIWDLYEFPKPLIGDFVQIDVTCIIPLEQDQENDENSFYSLWQLCQVKKAYSNDSWICEFTVDFNPEQPWCYENKIGIQFILDKDQMCPPYSYAKKLIEYHIERKISLREEVFNYCINFVKSENDLRALKLS